MALVGTYLQSLQREVNDRPPDPILAVDWLQQRYASVLERAPWNFLIKEGVFSTVPEATAGTVTLTKGSATVTETTSNANAWSSAFVGRYFRRDGDSEFYDITAYSDLNPDTLTLGRIYEGRSGTVIGYSVFQRFYSLASDVREVTEMTVIDTPAPMQKVSQSDIDLAIANRPSVGSPPRVWAPAGRDTSDVIRVEIYPIPDEAHGILYHYLQTTPSLADADTVIVPQVNYSLLRAGWLADYWGWLAARTDAPAQSIAMSQKFEAEFERKVQEMVIREAPNFPPERMRLSPRFIAHRWWSKWGNTTTNVRLP